MRFQEASTVQSHGFAENARVGRCASIRFVCVCSSYCVCSYGVPKFVCMFLWDPKAYIDYNFENLH